ELPRSPERDDARGFPWRVPAGWNHPRLRLRREGADPPLAVLPPDRPRRLLPPPSVPLLGRGEPRDVPTRRNVVGADPRAVGPDDRAPPAAAAAQGVTGKVFSRTSFARDRGGGRLSTRDRVLVLRTQLRRRHPVLRDLGRHVRIVEPPPPGMGRRLRGDARPCRFRNRRDAPLPEVGPAGSSTNRPPRRNRLNRPSRRTGPVSSARRRRCRC